MPPHGRTLMDLSWENPEGDTQPRLVYTSWTCDFDGCEEVVQLGEEEGAGGYVIHADGRFSDARLYGHIPTYDRSMDRPAPRTHRVFCNSHGLIASLTRYRDGEWERTPTEEPERTIPQEPQTSRVHFVPEPTEEDSMACTICGARSEDGASLRSLNYRWIPGRRRSERLRACGECRQGGPIIQCPVCRQVSLMRDEWPEWTRPQGLYSPTIMLPCREHSTSQEVPSMECSGCGETGVPGNIDYRNTSIMEDTEYGDEVRLEVYTACRSCSDSHPWMYCEGINCNHEDSPVYFTSNDPEFDRSERLCSDCPYQTPPGWFPEDDPADWELRPWCSCSACDWVRSNLPDTPDHATDEDGEEHPMCYDCRGSFDSNDDFEQIMTGVDTYESVCPECHIRYNRCAECETAVMMPRGGHRVSRQTLCASCLDGDDWRQCRGQCQGWYRAESECDCGGVFNYNYTPTFSPFQAKRESLNPSYTPYLGFEIEIEAPSGTPKNEAASLAHDADFLYPMHDGSLSHGIEIASMPLSFQWIKENELIIKEVLTHLAAMGWRSYDTETCGMHVHLSKKPLSKLHLLKLARMVYDYPGLCMAVGQRSRSTRGVSRYSSFQSEDLSRMSKKVRDEENLGQGHYVALNVEKEHTVEFRFFRGTLRWTSFVKNLEFVYALYEFTSKAGLRTSNESNFLSFLSKSTNIKRFPYLVDFLSDNYLVTPIKEAG